MAEEKLVFFESVKEITEKHKGSFAEIRKGLEEGLKEDDDVLIYRFLRGYQFDVPAATAALNKSLRWRKENKIDEIREKAVKMEPHAFPHYEKVMKVNPQNLHHGEDRQGQPFAVAHLGHSDPGLLAKTISEDVLREFMIYHLEYKRALVQKLSHEKGNVFRTVRIVDLSGLGSKHLNPRGLRVLRSVLGLVQDNYPEMVSNVYYVNAPWIFSTIWGMVKPWINASTLEKIRILGGDSKEELLKKIEAKQLPKYLGGECTCEDKGGCVPEPDPDAGLTKIVVPRAAHHEHTVEVGPQLSQSQSSSDSKETSSPTTSYMVTWEFRTDKHNIDFEVIFTPTRPSSGPSPPQQIIFTKQRVESSLHVIEGGFETPQTGTVTFRWDNTFSWTQGKTVLYRIDVVPKNSEERKEEDSLDSSKSGSSSTSSSSSSSTESSTSSETSSTSSTTTTETTTETTSS